MTTTTATTAARPEAPDVVGDLVDRYIALWNDPDPGSRADTIRALWAPTGSQVLLASGDDLEVGRRAGFSSATYAARGHAELEHRVAVAHAEFVAGGDHVFRLRHPGVRVGDLIKLSWDMVAVATGAVVGGGDQVLVLDDHGQVLVDHQFIAP